MAKLSFFTEEDVLSIISLPYRVGMHVSYAEDEDGEEDDEREMRALEVCIREIARVHEGEELTKEIAAEILNARDNWASWSEGVFNIEPLCEKAITALKTQAGKEEVKDYIKMTLDIATSVAQAYGEFGEEPEAEKGIFGKIIGGIVSSVTSVSADDAKHPMNVSAAEDTAIANIAAALKKAA
tara:strand:- start:3312 stop:3860 length:549 start_codon:yes stop_codon:yes gene_type:complete